MQAPCLPAVSQEDYISILVACTSLLAQSTQSVRENLVDETVLSVILWQPFESQQKNINLMGRLLRVLIIGDETM